jgi:hypothetical protein
VQVKRVLRTSVLLIICRSWVRAHPPHPGGPHAKVPLACGYAKVAIIAAEKAAAVVAIMPGSLPRRRRRRLFRAGR